MSDGIDLTDDETMALAWRFAGFRLRDNELEWGDLPELTEASFERLDKAISSTIADIVDTWRRTCESRFGVDSAERHRRVS